MKKGIKLIVSLFLVGSLIIFIGFSKGFDIASSLSRPAGATGWSIPHGLEIACTYVPIILGMSLIILGIIFSTVLFINWTKKNN